ncbi:AAA family ATPase [Ramlibacter tataouinensis]|uniref:ATP-dependent nuclease n=1 Tax=Ramlibacter tataouinensis TaxID=94132 RepID=UPI0022F3FC72|nr:AAA family ATPase [Ramlibacter tataouinensis]WBY03586.1 AAA family ATPase [Ramlibacter tataouinensis]
MSASSTLTKGGGVFLSQLTIKNFRQFGSEGPFTVSFNEGVTALVGENDAGKTAVMDAIRHVLTTRDMDFMRLQPEDFHLKPDGDQATEITIRARLTHLTSAEKGAFAEYLTYDGPHAFLYVHWFARRLADSPGGRRWVDVSVRSGPNGDGPTFESATRQLLATAYLRPLRDAEREMSPGRGSRLSQILNNFPEIRSGQPFDGAVPPLDAKQAAALSLAGLSDYMRHLVDQHKGVLQAQGAINTDYLTQLSLAGEDLQGRISFSDAGPDAAKLRQILERLELDLLAGPDGRPRGTYGLGSNNLLFMACELLLLGKEPDGLPLLLIEEPEAHLHPQRQLRLMEFLAAATRAERGRRQVQVILTSHSPNLTSKIALENIVLLHRQAAYSLSKGETQLSESDYRFLQRFLDVTKANLFFARGLIVVEGDGEAILLPTLARLLGRDLTAHGVSIINVGGTGLRRYARILQRREPSGGTLAIPTACLADMDVMPDCAPCILGLVSGDDDPTWGSPRRKWRVKREVAATAGSLQAGLRAKRERLASGDGQNVKTFVADEWTLEYDLAFSGLAREVYTAAVLAANDDALNEGKKTSDDVVKLALADYEVLWGNAAGDIAVLSSHIYEMFASKRASKSIAAQYLADLLTEGNEAGAYDVAWLSARLPRYIKDAVDFATTPPPRAASHVGTAEST